MRRGHGSTKVPNVKLRPALPSTNSGRGPSTKRVKVKARLSEDDIEGQVDQYDLLNSKKPFEGVVVCCTGIKHKASANVITHVCALERKIPIMQPEWVSETFERWVKGEDVSLEESERNYRLPAFTGYSIAITGENNVARRTELGHMINSNGGRYCKNLDQKVTHLVVCSPPSQDDEPETLETEKIQWARKVNVERKKHGVEQDGLIKLVWEEWLWDSVDWKGRWDEVEYRIDNPRPERKTPAPPLFVERPSFDSCSTSTQRVLASLQTKAGPSSHPSSRVSTSTVRDATFPGGGENADEILEIANTRRASGSQSTGVKAVLEQQLWKEIMTSTMSSAKGKGKELPPPPKKRVVCDADETEDEEEVPPKSVPRTLQVASSSELGEGSVKSSGRSFLSRVSSSKTAAFTAPAPRAAMSHSRSTSTAPDPSNMDIDGANAEGAKVFSGLRLRTLGQANADKVVNSLQQNGATVLRSQASDDLRDADYVIVRLQEAASLIDPNHPAFSKFRTECWVEYCLFEERVCEATESVVFTPLRIPVPIPGAEKISILWSGLENSQTYHIQRLCSTLGITVPPVFSRKTTHLICPNKQGPKYEKAVAWGIPVVDLEWLWNIAKTGVIEGLQGDHASTKRKASESPIVDITNGSSEESTERADGGKEKLLESTVPAKPSPVKALPFGQIHPALCDDDEVVPSSSVPSSSKPSTPAKSVSGETPGMLARKTSTLFSPTKRDRYPSVLSSSASSLASVGNLGTTLAAHLGKRSFTDSDAVAVPPKKKSRPPSRAKTLMDAQGRLSASVSPARPSPSIVPLPPAVNVTTETVFDELREDIQAESMRVVYEDPAQLAEKRKLLALIEGDTSSTPTPPPEEVPAASGKAKRIPRKTRKKSGF
ncbi:hypothetical protein FRB99_002912 [Tulasnella sp. 403]|nr:hypothetical protein FRB99_002912 [Tulasnella sp. 403]